MLFSSILLFLLIGYPYRFIFYKYCLIKKLGGAEEADQVVTIPPATTKLRIPTHLGTGQEGQGIAHLDGGFTILHILPYDGLEL